MKNDRWPDGTDYHRLQAALFEKGFSGTTTKEIAKASGISEAMIFRHFASNRSSIPRLSTSASRGRRPHPDDAVKEDDERVLPVSPGLFWKRPTRIPL
jgi:hypothetical protein